MRVRHARSLLIAAAVAAYLLACHLTTAPGTASGAGAALAVGPYMATALALAWRSPWRAPLCTLWLAAAAALWLAWPLVSSNFAWIYLLQHAGTFALLALAFGATLGVGREPMVTRFARLLDDPLPEPVARYTRAVTLAWVLFFLLMAAASLLLFAFGPRAVWSLLINVLTPGLVAAMFLAEYAVRRCVLPPALRHGLVDSVRAVWQAQGGLRSSPR
jgi:uncharacterized membrane protein